jgi:hypothetical protein
MPKTPVIKQVKLKAHRRPTTSTARPQKKAPKVRPAEKQVKMLD